MQIIQANVTQFNKLFLMLSVLIEPLTHLTVRFTQRTVNNETRT